MGVFDYVRCAIPLPLGNDWVYQTKDTDDPYQMEHAITVEGRLVRRNWLNGKDAVPEDQNYHGDLEFYPDCSVTDPAGDDLVYRATFRNGTVQEICQGTWAGGPWTRVYPPDEVDA